MIRYGDGLTIELADGETVVADASHPDGDVTVVSHAHGDHLYTTPPESAVWSPLTRALAGIRRDMETLPERRSHPRIDLLDAGHVPGSRAALLEGERTYLYTGDVSTRDRFGMTGFDPPSADVLIVESTYGTPEYTFPPVAEVQREFLDWLEANRDYPVVGFGYSLGRAQEVLELLARSDRDRIFVSPAIDELNSVIEAHTERTFPGTVFDRDAVSLKPGDALVYPGGTRSLPEDIGGRDDVVTAGLSGWAVDSSYRFARDLDAAFPLSDHCDFEELCGLVEAVDPEEVYTLHGSATEFAAHCRRELGYRATALKRDQRRLSEF